jgi:hypothetical protein
MVSKAFESGLRSWRAAVHASEADVWARWHMAQASVLSDVGTWGAVVAAAAAADTTTQAIVKPMTARVTDTLGDVTLRARTRGRTNPVRGLFGRANR